jgi:hypothetical protein
MELYLLSSKSLSDDENHIGRIWSRVESITTKAVKYATSIDRSNLVLMEVKRIDCRPTHKPFNTTLKKETWEKYLQVLQKVVTVIFRLESGDDRRKRYRLTEEQKELFRTASNDHSNLQTDGFYLNLLFSLLRQRIIDESHMARIYIVKLHVTKIQMLEDLIWRQPEIETFARLEDLVWRQSDMETFARMKELIWRQPGMETFARLDNLIWRQPDLETFSRLEDLIWRQPDMETFATLEDLIIAQGLRPLLVW